MSDAQAERIGAATGIIFVLLIAIGLFVVIPTPRPHLTGALAI